MYRKLISGLAVAVLATQVMAADNLFPSAMNPAEKDPSTVTQYIAMIWDDNAYSGLEGTAYENATWEAAAADKKWESMGRVGGKFPLTHAWNSPDPADSTKAFNPDNFQEGDIGMSWAIETLQPKLGGGHMTFNVITGQMATVFGGWVETPTDSTQIGYKDQAYETVDWSSLPTVKKRWSPVCWGREYGNVVGANKALGAAAKSGLTGSYTTPWKDPNADPTATSAVSDHWQWEQPNWTQLMYAKALKAGNEIGNHTIDHMETNSGLPKEFFLNGEGYDPYPTPDSTLIGRENKEAYTPWEEIGWDTDAGRKISQAAWGNAIKIAEDVLTEYLDLSVTSNNLFGFRAPRLEVNSNLYFALKDKGYLYACGLEEGYESYRDASNMLWPYTMDNGSMNVWTQKTIGEKMSMDSMPNGFWMIPVNAVVVPEDIRVAVWANHQDIVQGEIENGDQLASDTASFADWTSEGAKITSFDFNLFILWGVTKDQFVTIMKYNLDERMAGNRAPLHYGAHTEYYTPMYDIATLKSDANINAYGRCLKYNTFKDRIAGVEEFVTYATGKGAKFVTGKELIDKVKALQAEAPAKGTANVLSDLEWGLEADESGTSSGPASFTGNADNITVTIGGWTNDNTPWLSYGLYFEDHKLKSLDHIGITYKTTSPLKLKLIVKGTGNAMSTREVILANIGPQITTTIPISAFADANVIGVSASKLNSDELIGIELEPLAPENKDDGTYSERTDPFDITFTAKDITLYGDSLDVDTNLVAITDMNLNAKATLSLSAITSNVLRLNVGIAGNYNISIFTANGRMVKSLANADLGKGINNISLNNLSKGMYIVNIKGIDNKLSLTKSTLLMQ